MTPPRSPTRWTLVLVLVGAGVVATFQIGKAPAALPALREALALDLFAASWIISMFNALGLAAGMLIGGAAERVGHRRMAIGGLGLIALASAAGAAAPGAAPLLASRALEGAGVIAVAVSIPTLIVRAAAPGDLKLAMGMWAAYMPAGTGAMMALAPAVLAPLGWRGLWLANALLALGFALALAAATRALAVTPPPGGSFASAMRATLAAPGPPLLALSFATYTLQFLAVFGLLPTLLVEQDGLPPAAAALLGAIAIACNVPGNLLGGWLLHRGAPRWALIAGTSVAMGALALAIYTAGLALEPRFALLCLHSLLAGMIPAAVLGAAPLLAPSARHVALTNGLILQGSYLGQTVGPPAVAAIAQATGAWTWSPAVLCAAAALGVLLALALRRLDRRAAASAAR